MDGRPGRLEEVVSGKEDAVAGRRGGGGSGLVAAVFFLFIFTVCLCFSCVPE